MKKYLFFLLVFVSVIVLFIRFALTPMLFSLGYQTKAGIKISSVPEAKVFVNGVEVGKTPFTDENLQAGQLDVKLISDQKMWQGEVRLSSGTLTAVNRDLAENIASSSGEVLTLDLGKGVVLTSNPSQSDVEIDGQNMGKTPLLVTELNPGEHTFLISHNGFLKRSIQASTLPGLRLHLDVDLAVTAVDLGSTSVPQSTSLSAVKLVVKKTPLGFLRVRDKPSTQGVEVARVTTGEILIEVEQLSGWVKVELDDGTQGYVSSVYTQKQP